MEPLWSHYKEEMKLLKTSTDALIAQMEAMDDERVRAGEDYSELWDEEAWNTAKVKLNAALSVVRDAGDCVKEPEIIYRLSQCHANLGEFDEELSRMYELLEYVSQTQSKKHEFLAFYRIGCICEDQGRLAEAQHAFATSVTLAQAYCGQEDQIYALEGLLSVSRAMKRWDQMTHAASTLVPLMTKDDEQWQRAGLLCDLGCAYLRQELWTEAEYAFTELWEMPYTCQHYEEWCRTLLWIQVLGREQGHWGKAEVAAKTALRLLNKYSDHKNYLTMLDLIGEAHLHLGRSEDTIATFRELLQRAQSIYQLDFVTAALNGLERCAIDRDAAWRL